MRAASSPLRGWDVAGKHIHPPEAYTHMDFWLSHFEATFPDKAKKMRAYSESRGWQKIAHLRYWPDACISWLNKHADSAGEGRG